MAYNFSQLEELHTHTMRVMGFSTNVEAGNFISISDAGTLKITETHSGSSVGEIQPQAGAALKQLIELKSRNCIAISCSKGKVHIFNKAGSPLKKEKTLEIDTKTEIRGLAVSSAENFLVAGCKDGLITVYDLGQPGKERLVKELVSFMGKEGVRLVAWREKPRREIITADESGIVTIWDLKS